LSAKTIRGRLAILSFMNQKTRKIILYCLIFGFCLAAAGLILYSFGWSLGKTANGFPVFEKTGAIFLKTQPIDALIKINGKTYDRKIVLLGNNGSELIKGLSSGNYQVEVYKENYESWDKTMTISAGMISSASNIFLFPKEVKTEPVAQKDAEKIWLTDNQKEQIKEIFYSLKQKQLKMPGNVPITQIVSYPFDTSEDIVTTEKAIYLLNRQNFSLKLLFLVPSRALTINGSEMTFIDGQNNLQIYNLDSRRITENDYLGLTKDEEATEISLPTQVLFSKSNKEVGILTKKGELFIYDRDKKEIKKIGDGFKDFRFSPDGKKIAALNQNGEIEIIFPEDYYRDFTMAAGEKFKLNLSENSQPLAFEWLPKIPDHLIIRYADKTIVSEVDNRAPLNQWLLGNNIKDFAFDGEGILYFIGNDNQFVKTILAQNKLIDISKILDYKN